MLHLIVRSVLLVLVIILVLMLLFYPIFVKPFVRKIFKAPTYEINPDGRIINDNLVIYKRDGNRKALIIFIGGAFLFNNLQTHYGYANELFARAKNEYDVIMFKYPTRYNTTFRDIIRFKLTNTMKDMLLQINDTLKPYVMNYNTFHAISFSAGALLAGTFARKEQDAKYAETIKVPAIGLRFATLSVYCGLYETVFDSDTLTKTFAFYMGRNTPGANIYSCYKLDIPKYVVSATNDILYPQTAKYAKLEPRVTYRIFNKQKLSHVFPQIVDLEETKLILDETLKFIRQNEKTRVMIEQ